MLKRKKDQAGGSSRRSELPAYRRQQAYHYSAKRSSAERMYDRASPDESENTIKVQRFSKPQLAVIISIVLGLLYAVIQLPNAHIVSEGSSSVVRQNAAYQDAADSYLERSALHFVKPMLNERAMEEELKRKFPEISEVNVSSRFYSLRPLVTMQLATPSAIFVSQNKTFVLDHTGRAYIESEDLSSLTEKDELPIIQDQTGFSVSRGKSALTRSQLEYVHELVAQAAAKSLSIESIILRSGGGELDVRHNGDKYYVKYNMFEQARLSFGTFYAMHEQIADKKVSVTEYIDVRIPGRAYIK